MSKVSTNPPSGFRDFLPMEASARLELVDTITRVYRSHGFQTIGLPFFENLATLQGKGGGSDNEKLIFKVLKRGADLQRALEAKGELADAGLRFDLTLPLARYCARFREQLPKPFKVFQIGPVWRADKPQKGRFREFYQCDVDIIGAKETGAEIDCISAILEVFAAVDMLEGVEVHLNDRRLLSRWGGFLGVAQAAWAEALVTLDKLDKVGLEGVEKELREKALLDEAQLARFLPTLQTSFDQLFGQGSVSALVDESFQAIDAESVSSVEGVRCLLAQQFPRTKIFFNPTLVRGQDYYTGTIFEIRHPDLAGSLGGGGRYNRLMEVFGAPETPAFGGSIGFERLALLLQERNRLGAGAAGAQIFFPLFSEELRGPVFALAHELRKAGLRVDVFPDAGMKFGKQLGYADERKIPFALILGQTEAAAKQIKVKDMFAKTERTLSIESPEAFAAEMKKLCNSDLEPKA